MQSVINDVYLTLTAAAEVYFNKSVHTVNESKMFTLINVMVNRRYFSDKFSVKTKPFVNKTLKPYYGKLLITQYLSLLSY